MAQKGIGLTERPRIENEGCIFAQAANKETSLQVILTDIARSAHPPARPGLLRLDAPDPLRQQREPVSHTTKSTIFAWPFDSAQLLYEQDGLAGHHGKWRTRYAPA
jgi:hypothetical protein